MSQKNCKALVPLLFRQGYQKTPAINTYNRKTGFLDLPFEIREDIYVRVLRPDCNLFNPNEQHVHTYDLKCEKHHQHPKTFLGCTSLLMTCSQVYREAIELLHQGEVLLRLNHEQKKALRHPKAFGNPGYFQETIDPFDYAPLIKPVLPLQFDQLQLTRMRKLLLFIDFPSEDFDCVRIDYDPCPHPTDRWLIRIRNKVREVATAVSKSHTLETVRVILNRSHTGPERGPVVKWIQEEHSAALQHCFPPLINAAVRAGFTLVLDEFYDTTIEGAGPDPLVGWLRKAALDAGVKVDVTNTFILREVAEDLIQADQDDNDTSNADGDAHDEPDDPSTYPDVLPDDLVSPPLAIHPYELVPECRTCYATFRTWAELTAHLVAMPTHKKAFVKKTWNKLHPTARFGTAKHKCWTCAHPFKHSEFRRTHADTCRHKRLCVIARNREDNRALHWRMLRVLKTAWEFRREYGY